VLQDAALAAHAAGEEERLALKRGLNEAVLKCASILNDQQILEREKSEVEQRLTSALEELAAVRRNRMIRQNEC